MASGVLRNNASPPDRTVDTGDKYTRTPASQTHNTTGNYISSGLRKTNLTYVPNTGWSINDRARFLSKPTGDRSKAEQQKDGEMRF